MEDKIQLGRLFGGWEKVRESVFRPLTVSAQVNKSEIATRESDM